MKKSLVAFLVILTLTSDVIADTISGKILDKFKKVEKVSGGVINFAENELNSYDPWFDKTSNRGWILNGQGKKALEKLLLTLPCGWPEYGIPPLAPYTNEQLIIDLKNSIFETLTKLNRFRIDGLDILLIDQLKISYVFGKKVKYSVTFPKLRLTGKIDTDTFLSLMLDYGINVRFDGKGDFELILEDITIEGSFKYKVPFIFGSVKIYDFYTIISLGNVESGIKFEGTFQKVNDLLNAKIKEYLWKAVNYNKNQISDLIEEKVVPFVNESMKGHKIWYLIGKLGGSNKICYPPPIPWET